jgi:RNA polymerase sigma-70 factor (ECF subfamily)
MDDDELIVSLAGGDDTALREMFARHAPWLAARLRRALPSDDVEDVLQETFLAVWKNAKTYRPQGAPEAWLWVIARNQAALLLRKRGPAAIALLDEGPLAADPAESASVRCGGSCTRKTCRRSPAAAAAAFPWAASGGG